MRTQKKESKDCCPKFEPAPWDGKTQEWKNKPFIKGTIPQLFHVPLPGAMKHAMGRMWKEAENASAAPELQDFLAIAYDPSPWKSELYMAVTKDVPGTENTKLTGTFLTKVFDGPYNSVPKWIKEMDKFVASQGKMTKKYYFYYTTCPKCAKKYGHNYVVAFAQVD
ncbi:MAG: hypothetical protein M1469_08640 [Bacteroidetes bacterium]|nr:hypothetical protein [Bacteroidota bacterium]